MGNDELWVTKQGELLKVSEMHPDHVRNTLCMLIKQIREGRITQLGYHQERINYARALIEIGNTDYVLPT